MPIDCVRCGYCCEQGACFYGEWDAPNHQCTHLGKQDECGSRLCNKYEEIVEQEKDRLLKMFGCGCSSRLFNEQRHAVARKMGII